MRASTLSAIDRALAEIDRVFSPENGAIYARKRRIEARAARRALVNQFAADGYYALMRWVERLNPTWVPSRGLWSIAEALDWCRKQLRGQIARRDRVTPGIPGQHWSYRPDILRGARERIVVLRYFAKAGSYWWAKEVA